MFIYKMVQALFVYYCVCLKIIVHHMHCVLGVYVCICGCVHARVCLWGKLNAEQNHSSLVHIGACCWCICVFKVGLLHLRNGSFWTVSSFYF